MQKGIVSGQNKGNVESLFDFTLHHHTIGEHVQLQQPDAGHYCGQVEEYTWTEPAHHTRVKVNSKASRSLSRSLTLV